MVELKAFMHALEQHAAQAHDLKDKYEMLSAKEKEMVMKEAPDMLHSPDAYHHPVFTWLENLQQKAGDKTEY